MISFIFGILLLMFCVKMIGFAIKATWGIAKVVLVIVFFPAILVFMACGGLIYLALFFLIIGGIASLITGTMV